MSEHLENLQLDYYTQKLKQLAKKRGCCTWYTAQIIEIRTSKVVFGMRKVLGRLEVSKVKLNALDLNLLTKKTTQ